MVGVFGSITVPIFMKYHVKYIIMHIRVYKSGVKL
ncbi:Uncharacterised protein [Staphylococcus microti]|uniref:Uncharacterized protein n=1 Tax=Staphylococcus microti TaxID=569857 RepID=A0A380GU47_9STAP|nr:Uncharacterised protein [Staphylococcus microti]